MAKKLPTVPNSVDLGLLIVRVWIGLIGFIHGGQKLFGLFGGGGIKGFAGYLQTLNVPAPTASAVMAGLAEFGGGLLIALGIVPRLAAIPFAFTMLVAWMTAHGGKFIAQDGGGEYALTLAVLALAIAVAGPGRFTVLKLAK